MIIVNKPYEDFDNIDVKCYKCDAIFKVHPLTNMNAPFVIDCELHKPELPKPTNEN